MIVTDKKAFEENQHGGYRETQINGTLRAAGGVLRRRVGNSDNREYQDKHHRDRKRKRTPRKHRKAVL